MNIRKATQTDKSKIAEIRPTVYKRMIADGLNQWDDEYPTDEILFTDIDRGEMLVAYNDDDILGYVTVNSDIPEEYSEVDLKFGAELCVHRLSINPKFMRQGVAKNLMVYIHENYKKNGFKSICLDTCDENIPALKLYIKLGYIVRGDVPFERRPQYRFPVMEKEL